MNVLSLFAGIGGFDLGLERAGMTVVAQCERDEWCQQVLSKHWPNVPIYDDVTTLTAEKMKNDGIESIDLVCGGFPCQPFSVAGNRNGTKDDRHLWPEMLRIIEEIRPSWVVGENVAGITSVEQYAEISKLESQTHRIKNSYDDYAAVYLRKSDMLLNGIIEDLEKAGYSVQTFIIPACGVEARHIRDRLWIVANNESWDDGQCHAQKDQRQEQKSGIGNCKNHLSNTNNPKTKRLRKHSRKVLPKPKAERSDLACGNAPTPHQLNGDNRRYESSQVLREQSMQASLPRCKSRYMGRNTNSKRKAKVKEMEGYRKQNTQPSRNGRSGRCQWPAEPAVGRVADGVPNRLDRLRGLGNAVVPQIPELIGRMIMEIEDEYRSA